VTLLTIIQDAAVRCGWQLVPTSAIGNTGADALNIQQMIAFAQDIGRDCMERANWTGLDHAGTITGDGTTTLFLLPADWKRFNPGDKAPNSPLISSKYPLTPLFGPVNAEELNALKALPASTVRPVWRFIGHSIEIWPALTAGEIVTFNYFSSYWILAANLVTRRKRWVADTDMSLIEEDVIMKGVIWKWLASKGLDYAEQFRGYELALMRTASQQMTERITSTSTNMPNVYGGGFFGTITDNSTPI
jgi:hypothetical protein